MTNKKGKCKSKSKGKSKCNGNCNRDCEERISLGNDKQEGQVRLYANEEQVGL